MNLRAIAQRMSTARAEFHSTTNSVYGKFVVPPYIGSIDLANIDHSMAIVGGRGCGKTTYVRFFSHWTQFDPSRTDVGEEFLKTIVLYWKPDTTYFRSLTKSWFSEQNARIFFHALSGISCLKELLACLENIASHFGSLIHSWKATMIFGGDYRESRERNITQSRTRRIGLTMRNTKSRCALIQMTHPLSSDSTRNQCLSFSFPR